jgi:parallel beta-helix repeat protein
MKDIIKKNREKYSCFSFFVIILLFIFLSACGGVTPGTDPPTISSFTASSTNIMEGESVTLYWVTADATTVYLGQVSELGGSTGTVDPSGTKTVSPSETTTYTLTANNGSGSDSSTITITVTPGTAGLPTIDSFTASSTNIAAGESVTLSWETSGATSVYLEHSSLSSAGSRSVALSGSETVSPSETTTYTLTAINDAGSDEKIILIAVHPEFPVCNLTKGMNYSTIQAAINDSDSGNIIEVTEGTYYENIMFDNRDITLRSKDPSDPDVVSNTIIDGGENDSVVVFTGGDNSTLAGFVIRNGDAQFGGGIYVYSSSSPTIISNTITENRANLWGGGIHINKSSPVITHNTISDNYAGYYGGGIRVYNESSPEITDNIIIDNGAYTSGGGIYTSNGSPIVQNNAIMDNWAYEETGGGIGISIIYPGTPTIGGTSNSDTGHFNTICGNSPAQVDPDDYPHNDICEECPCP